MIFILKGWTEGIEFYDFYYINKRIVMKDLKESLLSSFDKLNKSAEQDMYLRELYKIYEQDHKKREDIFGKKIKIGDLVIINQSHGYPMTGKVVDIKNNEAAVSLLGDGTDITINYGKLKGQYSQYHPTYSLIKINDKILELIYNI